MSELLDNWLERMPVVAIIRGVQPSEAADVGSAIYEAGVGIIEVPLNSPRPFESIENLSRALGDQCIIGCGTLVDINDAQRVADAGGKIAVTPNTDPSIIQRCLELNMQPIPGWATPSEAFSARQAGARYLKLFPAGSYGTKHIQAVRAVLPNDTKVLAVGGVSADNAKGWFTAGVDGLGIGSEIYQAGRSATEVYQRTVKIVQTLSELERNSN